MINFVIWQLHECRQRFLISLSMSFYFPPIPIGITIYVITAYPINISSFYRYMFYLFYDPSNIIFTINVTVKLQISIGTWWGQQWLYNLRQVELLSESIHGKFSVISKGPLELSSNIVCLLMQLLPYRYSSVIYYCGQFVNEIFIVQNSITGLLTIFWL